MKPLNNHCSHCVDKEMIIELQYDKISRMEQEIITLQAGNQNLKNTIGYFFRTYGDNNPIDGDTTVVDSIIHQSNVSGNNIHGTHVTRC